MWCVLRCSNPVIPENIQKTLRAKLAVLFPQYSQVHAIHIILVSYVYVKSFSSLGYGQQFVSWLLRYSYSTAFDGLPPVRNCREGPNCPDEVLGA